MPTLYRTVLTILGVLVLAVGALHGQDEHGVQVIRSDQVAALTTLTLNFEEELREFIITAEDDAEPGWTIFYLHAGVVNITAEITSAEGVTFFVPPVPDSLEIQVVFVPTGAAEGSIKTATVTAVPVDGQGPPQLATFQVRLLDKIMVNDPRDLADPVPEDVFLDADPDQPGEQTTLRAALDFCNERPGLDCVGFDLPGPGIPRILPESPLPEITGPVEIDGFTQPTAELVGVEISGEALAAQASDGLVISGGESTLRGLSITRFRSARFGAIPSPAPPNPSGILLKSGGGNTIEDCFLGLAPGGAAGAGNEGYGIRIESSDNSVKDCLVSGNWVGGIGIFGGNARNNTVTSSVGGDFGQTRSSNFLAPPLVVDGVALSPRDATPEFASLDSNLANSSIHFLNLNENAPWESGEAGFLGGIVLWSAPGNSIVDSSVQGNGADGIRLIGDGTGTLLESNTVGQPASGPPSLRNAGHGIALQGSHARLNRNDASGNRKSGVLVRGINNVVAGITASRNGGSGIRCEGQGTTIGGTTFAARGQIFGNAGAGILITAPPTPVSYLPGLNRVVGNLIGIESPFGSGVIHPRPNRYGIRIDGSDQNIIGASAELGEGNLIAYNYREGILVTNSRRNVLYGNIALHNQRLDIDLSGTVEGDGPDPPDPGDPDAGGNDKTNAPTLSHVVQTPSELRIAGTLLPGSAGNHVFEFAILRPDLPLSVAQTVALQNIDATPPQEVFSFRLPSLDDLTGAYLRAAVTNPSFNGSEYSRWVRVEGPTQTDPDGVSDEIESLAPSRGAGPGDEEPPPGDGNGDGQADARQGNVTSFPLLQGGFLTLAAPGSQSLSGVAASSTAIQHPNSHFAMTHGTWTFQVDPLVGPTATVTVLIPGDAIATGYYNFGPTPGHPEPHWYEFLFDGTTGAQLLSDRVVLHFLDGGRGDHDLEVNGVIETDGGMAHPLPAPPDPEFTLLADRSLVVSWDREFAGLFLQETTAPETSLWQFTAEPAFESAGSHHVRVLPDQGTELFRLVRP